MPVVWTPIGGGFGPRKPLTDVGWVTPRISNRLGALHHRDCPMSPRGPLQMTSTIPTRELHPDPTYAPTDATSEGTLDRLGAELATELDGALVRPEDQDWDTARQAWHLDVDQRPAAVVVAGSVRDVVAVVNAARRLGLRVAPQSTGHNAAPLGRL